MPSIEKDCRNQKAVYWAYDSPNEFGQPTVSAPIELDVRWEDKREEALDANGSPVAVEATVVVDRVIPVGSILWKGSIAELPGTSSTPETDVMEVLIQSNIPDVKGRETRRVVKLGKRSDKMVGLA